MTDAAGNVVPQSLVIPSEDEAVGVAPDVLRDTLKSMNCKVVLDFERPASGKGWKIADGRVDVTFDGFTLRANA